MFPNTTDRVAANTCEEINQRIRRQTEANIEHYGSLGHHAITRRLSELDAEWDIERCLETMAPVITLTGIGLGLNLNRRFLFIPLVVQSFLIQHALQGWCPPIPVLRRLGIRTTQEIDAERTALKVCRGDFATVSPSSSTQQLFNLATR